MSDRTLAHYAEILRSDFAAFVQRSFAELRASEPFQFNWHIEVLAEKLEAVRLGRTKRLIVNLPPRHMKSFVGSVAFPAFILGHRPETEVLCVSYGQDLAEEFSRSCLTLMQSAFYQAIFKTRLSPDRQAVEEFKTTAGGCRRATSLSGGLTGRGADLIIIDDPIKADDSQSEARRASVNANFYNTIYSRLNNKETGAIVIIMQRLHADDLVSFVQEREKWEVTTFPAIAEHDEVRDVLTPYGIRRIGRRAGEALNPARESLATLEEIKSRDEYVFSAQYQQEPQPPGGIFVKREWLKYRFDLDHPPAFEMTIQAWDTASKTTELSDFSVCTTWGLKDHHLYLLDVFRQKREFPQLMQAVRDLARQYGPSLVLVEDNASGISLIQQLRADGLSMIQAVSTNEGDKVMRLRAQTPKIANGFAVFPEHAPWLDAYLFELTTFPNSKHDDQVDSTVHALAWLTESRNSSFENAMEFLRLMGEQDSHGSDSQTKLVKIRARDGGTLQTIDGKRISFSAGEILTLNSVTAGALCHNDPHRFERIG